MLAEALTELASVGGTALVTAMVTDSWEGVRTRVAHVLGRGHVGETALVEAQLEQSRAGLAGLTGLDLDRARAEQETVWRGRLSELLEQYPAAEAELRTLVVEVEAQTIGSGGRVEQHSIAFDQAQQAVQGQGVQNITFGNPHEPGPGKG